MNQIDAAISQYSLTIQQLSARLAQAAVVGLLLSTSALAAEQIDPAELQGQLQARQQLLTRANDELAGTMGKLNAAVTEIERLKKAAAECAPKKAEDGKPKP